VLGLWFLAFFWRFAFRFRIFPMTILETIVAEKRREIARLPRQEVTVSLLRAAIAARGRERDFLAALSKPKPGSIALIAEVKKASPSAGVICANFDPVRIAREYEAAGASCLSVLTDAKFFQGSLEFLRSIRQAVNLPLLRKDFIIDERQILEAVEWGADAILLIVAILDDQQLKQMHTLAREAGLAVLVEAHDEKELDRALGAGARLIGVNNRDLKTFKVDLATTERLAGRLRGVSRLDPAPLLVAESGIHNRSEVERLARSGVQAILVGESLMREADMRAKVRELIGTTTKTDLQQIERPNSG
jgi:indole-3-glycerol phosphate synthase